jgi:hypothetical protein
MDFEYVRDLYSDLSSAMARHSLKLAGRPLHLRAFFNVRPHVISGHPFGLECATQPVSNCRGARVIGILLCIILLFCYIHAKGKWPIHRDSVFSHQAFDWSLIH